MSTPEKPALHPLTDVLTEIELEGYLEEFNAMTPEERAALLNPAEAASLDARIARTLAEYARDRSAPEPPPTSAPTRKPST